VARVAGKALFESDGRKKTATASVSTGPGFVTKENRFVLGRCRDDASLQRETVTQTVHVLPARPNGSTDRPTAFCWLVRERIVYLVGDWSLVCD